MRLISLTVRNYRVHKDLTVNFDPSRNLIGGPNESGKSTLAEAIHRALFLRAKTGGKTQKEMVSSCHLGDPEILLTFEAANTTWELEKRFAGSKGSTRLTRNGSSPLKDDEAEAQLSALLKSETASGGGAAKLLPTLWAHLWVWQGSSGEDPSAHASDHKDTLVQRLQQDGLAAVMQSATDQRVRERIAADYDALFTATGKPKAGSKPELARTLLTEAETTLARARETADRLKQAAAEHDRAEKEIVEADAVLPSLRDQKTATETQLAEVEKLRLQEESQRHAWETAATLAQQLAENDTTIRKLQEQTISSRDSLAPAERMEASLITEEKSARDLSQAAEVSQRQSADAIRLTRLRHDLASASISAFEKAADNQRLTARAEDAKQLRAEIATHHEALSQLPDLSAKDLDALRQLDRASHQASASLKAMAASIELLAADLAVTLDGQPFPPGESRTLTDAGELTVGPGTRLRILPGGGTSLAEARLSQQRHAKAIELLHQLFSSSREAIDRSLVQPLADRISGYLQCLFGPAAQVRVNLSETGIEGLELLRPNDSTFTFQTLSGGAKEQVAAAVRLAMAEILATDHDGSLPILFDDAFAYTDPERVQSLQRMLNLAALRGLQVIVLTCAPADYSALGANVARLNRSPSSTD